MRRSLKIALAAMSMGLLAAGAASAGPNLVTNGGFESTTSGPGQLAYNTNATDWSIAAPNNSYTFLYVAGTADVGGSSGEYGSVSIWGPGNGIANGLPAASPNGGNFIASDPAFQNNSPLTQTINGLTAGDKYVVSFYWAGAQQTGFTGATTEAWTVDLGSAAAQSTPTASIPSQGFSGWTKQSFTFTADGPSDVLSFLSTGGPSGGQPPFALLDGVSLTAVPEPASWAFMLVGFGGLGVAIRSRRSKQAAAA